MKGETKVMGVRSNTLLFVAPVVFAVSLILTLNLADIFAAVISNISPEWYKTQAEKGYDGIDMYFDILPRRSILGLVPLLPPIFTIASLILFVKRIMWPANLIEYDDKGFYLNKPFNKTWFLRYGEITSIYYTTNESKFIKLIPRRAFSRYYGRRRDRYEMMETAPYISNMTFGMNVTGTVVVTSGYEAYKVEGVKNALLIAQEMQIHLNDAKKEKEAELERRRLEKEKREREIELKKHLET